MDSILTADEERAHEKIMDNANDLFKQYKLSKSDIKKYFDAPKNDRNDDQ